MKVSDYVIEFLADLGIRHSFVVQGGAVAHLIDSMNKSGRIDYVCVGHEQAGAIAVHGYAARQQGFGCAMATTGPGVINMINGIACLYYDSMPSIFIGGQVTSARNLAEAYGVRQIGFQESPHAAMCAHVTKYSATVRDAGRIRYELEKAVHIARSGRPGPVFLDICDDVQREDVDPGSLARFVPEADGAPGGGTLSDAALDTKIDAVMKALAASERPLLLLGYGIHLAGVAAETVDLAERLGIPCVLTWGGLDLLPDEHPLKAGGFGVHSPRGGNFAVQNSDFVLCIGARLSQHQTGTPAGDFARAATRAVVEIDPAELAKLRKLGWPVEIDIPADAGRFVHRFLARSNEARPGDLAGWKARIADWRERYGRPQDETAAAEQAEPYACVRAICEAAPEGAYIFGDVGATLSWMYQAFRTKKNQRLLTSFNNHTMGYALPAAIGAALADPDRKILSLNGDGGFLMNIQELGTVADRDLDIAILILNNRGYGVIQQTQEDYFQGRYNGVTPETGLMEVDYVRIAQGFGVAAFRVGDPADMAAAVRKAVEHRGPMLLDIPIDPRARIVPTIKNQRPLEDMSPLLARAEFHANMIVPPLPISSKV